MGGAGMGGMQGPNMMGQGPMGMMGGMKSPMNMMNPAMMGGQQQNPFAGGFNPMMSSQGYPGMSGPQSFTGYPGMNSF
jgi:hypothetical protein